MGLNLASGSFVELACPENVLSCNLFSFTASGKFDEMVRPEGKIQRREVGMKGGKKLIEKGIKEKTNKLCRK